MRREAVQEERHRSNGRESRDGKGGENEVESTSPGSGDMPIDRIVEAETIADNSVYATTANGNGNIQVYLRTNSLITYPDRSFHNFKEPLNLGISELCVVRNCRWADFKVLKL